MRSTLMRLLATAPLVAASCTVETPRAASTDAFASDSAALRAVLLAEVKDLASDPASKFRFDAAKVGFQVSVPSKAVPGLIYHWGGQASNVVEEYGTSGILALIGQRDRKVWAIRTAVDWSELARGWTASSRDEAAWACAELYRIQYGGGPRDQAEVYGLDTLPTLSMMPGDAERYAQEISPTIMSVEVRDPMPMRRLRFWIINPELRTLAEEIACELPEPMWDRGRPATLAIIRSLVR